MGIYFRDSLRIRISRRAKWPTCIEEKIMTFSPHFQLFYLNNRITEIFIKMINHAYLFSQPPLLLFTKGADIGEGYFK